MKMSGIKLFSAATVVLSLVAASSAVVSTEAVAQNRAFVAEEKKRNLPARGQTQSRVLRQFGEPTSRIGAVGDPPISSWNYPNFIVYFEYSHVITTVAEQDSLPVSLGDIQ